MSYRARAVGRRRRAAYRASLREPLKPVTLKDVNRILARAYPRSGGWVYPLWAKLALSRRWMTREAYEAAAYFDKRAGVASWLYESYPMLALIPKQVTS